MMVGAQGNQVGQIVRSASRPGCDVVNLNDHVETTNRAPAPILAQGARAPMGARSLVGLGELFALALAAACWAAVVIGPALEYVRRDQHRAPARCALDLNTVPGPMQRTSRFASVFVSALGRAIDPASDGARRALDQTSAPSTGARDTRLADAAGVVAGDESTTWARRTTAPARTSGGIVHVLSSGIPVNTGIESLWIARRGRN